MSRRTPLIGWLAAEAVSLTGTRVSMIAIPWFVLTTTGSATLTGAVAFAEMGPYVAAKALAGPIVDRVGAARVAATADGASVAVVGAIPLLHALDLLSYPLLLALVAVAGTLRGPPTAPSRPWCLRLPTAVGSRWSASRASPAPPSGWRVRPGRRSPASWSR